jgi:hypothetical protein
MQTIELHSRKEKNGLLAGKLIHLVIDRAWIAARLQEQ